MMAKKPKHIEQRIKAGKYYVSLDQFKEQLKQGKIVVHSKGAAKQNDNLPTN